MGKTAEAIGEGVSIAAAAARLTVRNRILVETIANNETFQYEPFEHLVKLPLALLRSSAGCRRRGGR